MCAVEFENQARPSPRGDGSAAQVEDRVIEILREVASEIHAGTGPREPITLDSDITADLGLDSLARTEALLRIQQAFAADLPDSALLAETPRELVRMLLATAGTTARVLPTGPSPQRGANAPATIEPHKASTFFEALTWHAEQHPDRRHALLLTGQDAEPPLSYGELLTSAYRAAGALQQADLQRGDTVILMLPTSYEYLACFMGALIAGGIPVPIYPPARVSQVVAHLRRHRRIIANAGAQFLIADEQIKRVADALRPHLSGLGRALIAGELLSTDWPVNPYTPSPEDTAMLQYTSGSTGDPKGVVLSHANLLNNIRAAGSRLAVSSEDVFVSWLPLYHDMGLIGAWLGSLYFGCTVILMSPLRFLARPSRWFRAIHEHGGTISAAPNFAYELCLREIRDAELEGLNLESWRHALNGAEPVSPAAVRAFCNRFAAYGLRAEAMKPAYGLAEACVALTIPDHGTPAVIERIDRQRFERSGIAAPAAADDPAPVEFISCGRVIAEHEVRVVDMTDHELPERHEGRLQFRGPSATAGYFRNPQATEQLFRGEWLEAGDRAYVAGGLVFITGRVKDMIIRGGRNIHPSELDAAIGAIRGIREHGAAAFGSADAAGTERLVIVAETTEDDPAARHKLVTEIKHKTAELLAMPPDDVVLVPADSILKTPSGKIQRAATRELYERGDLGKAPRFQYLTMLASLGAARLRTWLGAATVYGYSAWVWLVVYSIGALAWTAIALLPGISWRWAALRAGIRAICWLAGIPVRLRGQENLPRDRPFILLCNHTSYLDGLFLLQAVDQPVAFLAKTELKNRFISRVLLQRLDALYVDRADIEASSRAPDVMVNALEAGRSVLVFPEGTFLRPAGLLPFRMGAFLTAAKTAVDVIPAALRGSRSIMRAGSWLIRSGSVFVCIEKPLQPDGNDWHAAVRLRDASRQAILRNSGEPDAATGQGAVGEVATDEGA